MLDCASHRRIWHPLQRCARIATAARHPKNNLRDANTLRDFWSRNPETLHQVTILMSDHGIPKNYRQMHGFGPYTFSLINA
ncbi:Catalase [Paraburkholderia fynbosensis]|uniref:catalase n=1 Tax=Paraburkholderia fynbosensis TaxID=1200993 RepID=A0A6J5FXK8_9BURK|nr:Catalase [Paraburkholderia fynbosensis]